MRKSRELFWISFCLPLLLALIVASLWSFSVNAETQTQVRFIPDYVVSHSGEMLTFACVIENVSDLEGVDIFVSWNTAYLNYVTHTVTMPVEDFPSPIPPSPYAGIVHSPPLLLKDDVMAGTYWVAFATLGGPSFNGSGTVFTITFMTMSPHPHPCVDTTVHFEFIHLFDGEGEIEYDSEDAVVRILRWDVNNHDIAVKSVATSKDDCLPVPSVGKGCPLEVVLEVENQGDYAETFDTRIYANAILIGELLNSVVQQGETTTVTVVSQAPNLVLGNYTISAVVERFGDVEPADNSMVDGVILVTIVGDVDADRDVDIFDIVRLGGAYGAEEPDPFYDPNCDSDDDGEIDIFDAVAAADHYGESW